MPDKMPQQEPTIAEFFAHRCIFITGGSGFMGKVLVEKLLRSCPDISRIYLLFRGKRGKTPEERFEEISRLPLFDRLHHDQPDVLKKKIVLVNGDVKELNLGLSAKDRRTLETKVSIIFHVAASVRFDDPLKDAVILNARGAREVMKLAENVTNLQALLHVSTAYCNTDKKYIDEEIYPPHADWRKTIKLAEKYDSYHLNILTQKYMGGQPNTYTFTKSLAEHIINDLGNDKIPIIIVRPSIVISSLWEPMKGWIDNFNGPVGIIAAFGLGITRTFLSDPDIIADYMPVDIAIKAMIVAVWKKGIDKSENKNKLVVYNCSSSSVKNITMSEMVNLGLKLTNETPMHGILWIPGGGVTKYRTWNYIQVLILHLIPALVIDLILKIAGQQFRLLKIQRRIFIANLALEYFITNQWQFHNANFLQLEESILDEDRVDWSYDFANEDVELYFHNCMVGGKEYLLKEDPKDFPQAKRHHRRMYWLDKIVRILFWIFIISMFFRMSFPEKIYNAFARTENYLTQDS